MEVIVPNNSNRLIVLEEVDLRLSLILEWVKYRSDTIARNPQAKEITTFNQWLCWNRYGSLAMEEKYVSIIRKRWN